LASSAFVNALLQKNIELEALHHQPLSCAKPIDMSMATYHPSQAQQMLPFNVNAINSPMLMMMMNHEDFGQFGVISRCSTTKSTVHYSYDPATEMIGIMMFNNPRLHSVS
jgi:hypothetical protein